MLGGGEYFPIEFLRKKTVSAQATKNIKFANLLSPKFIVCTKKRDIKS